jgi:molybdopterin synthase catalytic subunit
MADAGSGPTSTTTATTAAPAPPAPPAPARITVRLTDQILDVPAFSAAVAHPGAGAVATFVGTTRDSFQGRPTLRLEYEAYEPMALAAMRALASSAAGRWDLKAVAIGHRTGTVGVGEASVVIATSSPHRADALAAVAWAIDELKATVPIWKKEFFAGGEVWQENAEQRLLIEAARKGQGGRA